MKKELVHWKDLKKINKPLAKLEKKKMEKMQITSIMTKTEDIIIDPTDITKKISWITIYTNLTGRNGPIP